MSTTETTEADRAKQIRDRLAEIAPWPEWGTEITAEGVARYLAVCAQISWIRNVTPFIRSDQEIPVAQVVAQFAAAHALLALAEADPDRAKLTAAQIADAWNDGGGIGEWLWEHLTALGIDVDEIGRLDTARLALDKPAALETSLADGPCCTGCGPACACGGSPHETERTDR